MKRTTFILTTLAVTTALSSVAAAQSYPERPIEFIVPWGAGGGTDAVARLIASEMEEALGVNINVVNRTGGSGVVGHSAIAEAEPDGYTIGLATVEIAMMHHQGLTELTYEDLTPIALVNSDGGGLMVSADSEYETAGQLLEAIEESEPGTFAASGTGQGGIWHLGLAGWLLSEGLEADRVTWVPSDGAASGLSELVAGGVDIVPASTAEGRSMIESERVRPLAHMANEPFAPMPDIPTLKDATGSDWTNAAWRVVTGPADLPDEVVETLADAAETAYNSDAYKEFADENGFGRRWAGPQETREFMADADQDLGEVMREAGLTSQ